MHASLPYHVDSAFEQKKTEHWAIQLRVGSDDFSTLKRTVNNEMARFQGYNELDEYIYCEAVTLWDLG